MRLAWMGGRFLGLAVGGLIALTYLNGGLLPFDRAVEDARSRLISRPASGQLVVVTIDAESLQWLDVWPWPRRHFATVLDRLLEAGAERVALDIDFAARSDADNDRRLAEALAAAGPERVALPVFRQLRGPGSATDSMPLPAFAAHTSLAHADFAASSDGLIRRFERERERAGQHLPGMAQWLLGAASAPASGLIDFSIDPATIPRISFADLLEGTFDPDLVRGRHVLIGATALELGDVKSVPRYRLLAGPMIHALVYETLLRGNPLREVSGWTIAVLTFLLGLGLTRLLVRAPPAQALAVTVGALVALTGLSSIFRPMFGLSIDVAAPAIVVVFALIVALLWRSESRDELLREITNNSFDAIVIFDRSGRIIFDNRTARRLFGVSEGHLAGIPLTSLITEGDQLRAQLLAGNAGQTREILARRASGDLFPAEVALSGQSVGGRWVGVVAVRDITERKSQQARLIRLAMHDSLTGLVNRTVLFERTRDAVAAARAQGRRLALLLLDLDRFKEVNDTLGHHIGDELLKQIGPRLEPCLREDDTLARLGGDEFAVLLPGARDIDAAHEVARRIIESLRRPFVLGELQVEVAASIGIVVFPDHACEPNELLQRADVAMYAAKRQKLGTSVYEPERDEHSVRRLILHGELRRAIDDGGLQLFYQPKIHVESGSLSGVEALVRWPHATLGQITPEEFIPFAEQTGLIRPLTDWALDEALAQHRRWRQVGYDIPVAVNLAAQSLQDPMLVERIAAILGDSRGGLRVEITESSLMADPAAALRVLEALSRLGCKPALDDFGTGYSCLAYLQRLPIDQLKIDRSFVIAMASDPGAIAIVRSIIRLAHSLGLTVVAEGVEKAVDLEALRRLGCDEVQGFLFAGPMEPSAFGDWLQSFSGAPHPNETAAAERLRRPEPVLPSLAAPGLAAAG